MTRTTLELGLLVSIFFIAGCSGSSTNTGSSSGSSSGGSTSGSSSGGSTGGGATSVNASDPRGAVVFDAQAVAHDASTAQPILYIHLYEGTASCGAVSLGTGKHDLALSIFGVAGTSPAITAGTYDNSNTQGFHAEAYLNLPCDGNAVAAQNGGDKPFSLTITSIDTTQVSGTFNFTMTQHISGGQDFPMTGSFVAPLCGNGVVASCP